MTKVAVTESYLEDIADAIRSKNGSSDTYTPAEMADAIDDIPSGTDGNNLEYGYTDATSAMVGVGKVGQMEIE